MINALILSRKINLSEWESYVTKLNDALLFWLTFIFTRPFGATFGDFLTKPVDKGGLSLSRGYSSLITLVLLAVVLFISTRKERPVRHH